VQLAHAVGADWVDLCANLGDWSGCAGAAARSRDLLGEG
jgi:hypothetical protein